MTTYFSVKYRYLLNLFNNLIENVNLSLSITIFNKLFL